MKRFVTLIIVALHFIMPTLMSCSQPTIVDSTPQNETTTTTSSSTIVDKDPIVMSRYGDGGILLQKYKSNPSPYGEGLSDSYSYYIRPYEELEIEPGKYFIQSRSLDRPGRHHANGDFYFDNVVLKVNKKYWIDRDHIEEKNW